jgi:hypothetical protein
MPAGIGLLEDTEKDVRILIDPLTRETISNVPELDESGRKKVDYAGNVIYKANDHWFQLDVKFIWKDAPKDIKREVTKKKEKAKKVEEMPMEESAGGI